MRTFTIFLVLFLSGASAFGTQEEDTPFSLRKFYARQLDKVRRTQQEIAEQSRNYAQARAAETQKKADRKNVRRSPDYYTINRSGKRFLRSPQYINRNIYLNAVQLAPAILPSGKYSARTNTFSGRGENIMFDPETNSLGRRRPDGRIIMQEMALPAIQRGSLRYFPAKEFLAALDSLELYDTRFARKKAWLSPRPGDTAAPDTAKPSPRDSYRLPPDLVRNLDTLPPYTPSKGIPGDSSYPVSRNILGDTIPEEPAEPPETSGPVFSGLVDAYYSFNLSQPLSRTQNPENFEFYHNQFSLNLIRAEVRSAAAPLGYTLDLMWGPTIEFINANDIPSLRFIMQAYGSYRTGDWTLDLGKFNSFIGAEEIATNENLNYSRSYIFANTPFTHTGLRVKYQPAGSFSLMLIAANGWDRIIDNNSGKTFGARFMVSPFENLRLSLGGMAGPEQSDNNNSYRQVFDAVMDWQIAEPMGLRLNYYYGTERFLRTNLNWLGFSTTARFMFSEMFTGTLRAEIFNDWSGVMTGMDQTLREVTLTGDFRPVEKLMLRGELRYDRSTRAFFRNTDGGPRFDQVSLTGGVILTF